MYLKSVNSMSELAKQKIDFLNRSKLSYIIASALAGAYVGLGIALVFSIATPIAASASPFLKMIMGASFGVALTLVIFAGSELFTGNNMIMTLGVIKKKVSFANLCTVWCFSWIGNLIGSLFLAYIVVQSGAISQAGGFIEKVANAKMHMPISQLFIRGILCNWLVCLAIWTSSRTKSDTTKCILIFWCLFAFISSGYEHSIANMSLLAISLFGQHSDMISWSGYAYNLLWVTLGNIVGGSLFVGGLYYFATNKEKE